MTKVHEIQLKLSECREKINAINGAEADPTATEIAELRTLTDTSTALEVQYRAALAAEDVETRDARARFEGDPHLTPEQRERETLRERATFSGYLLAALQGREPAGAEAEYRAAVKGKAGGIPLSLFEPTRARLAEMRQRAEVRVDAATVAPSTGTGNTVFPVQPHVFSESIAPMLGIDMPTVGSGGFTTMRISTALTAGARTKGDARDSTAAVLTPVTANPRSISGRLTLQIEDVAAVGVGSYESALRQNLTEVLSDAYDTQCITGNGTAPNVDGLVNQLTDPTNPTAVADFSAFLAAAAGQIEGLWARKLQDVKIITNPDAYKLSAQVFRAASSDLSFSDYARQALAGWSTNSRMPDTASTIARGIVYRQGRPGLVTAQHPVWDSVMIDDIYSDSASGERHVSLHLLVGDKVIVVQPDAYALVEYKVA